MRNPQNLSAMASNPPLLQGFLSAAGPARAAAWRALPGLAGLLSALLEAGQRAHPSLRVPAERFGAQLGRNATGKVRETELQGVHAGDLFLAVACAGGDPAALRQLERGPMAQALAGLTRMDPSPSFTDEVRQLLRQKLLMPDAGGLPRIADYSGRGSLRNWLKAAAVRTALNHRRDSGHNLPTKDEEALLALPAPEADPELHYLKATYRAEFKVAFTAALASLTQQERNILRLHVLDGLGTDEIGTLFRVHRTTIARWIGHAREALLEETRRTLSQKLNIDQRELDSLLNLVASQLDVSLSRFLQRSKP